MRRDVAEQLRERAERQVVGLDRGCSPPSRASFGTSAQWPPIARLHQAVAARDGSTRGPCRRRARRRTRSVRSRGEPLVSRNRCSSAAISSSGVPLPTNPENATVSPSRTIARASAAETILFFTRSACAFERAIESEIMTACEPVDDAVAEDALRLAADEHADVAAGQGRSRCSRLVPTQLRQGPRALRRNDVVLLRVDVEHRHRDLRELDLAAAEISNRFLTSWLSW